MGTGWLSSLIAGSNYLEPYIKENDRTPSWDGSIFVYSDSSKTKEFLKGSIPVQVKSVLVESFSNGSVSYQFDVADLQVYFRTGGINIFVVENLEINKQKPLTKKVFYRSLYPSDLKEILREVERTDQATKSIKLTELDTSSLAELETICKNFLVHKEKQISTISHSLPIEEAESLRSYLVPGEYSEEYLFSRKHPLYGKRHKEDIECVVSNVRINSLHKKIQGDILINRKVCYHQYEIVRQRGKSSFRFGKDLNITITPSQISFSLSGSIEDQLLDINTLLNLIQYKNIQFTGEGGGEIQISKIDEEEQLIQNLTNHLNILNDTKALLIYFQVDPIKLDLEKVYSTKNSTLDILINRFVYGRKIIDPPFKTGFNIVQIGNIRLGIFVREKNEDKKFNIYNLVNLTDHIHFSLESDDLPRIKISPYILFKADFLVTIDNIDTEMMLQNIKDIPIDGDESYSGLINLFGLELIKAFDDSKREVFLETAKRLFDWLMSIRIDDPISKTNAFQIIKRQRSYTQDEKTTLISMREEAKANENFALVCGTSILLENKGDVEDYFDKLSKDQKKEFITYPIYTLAIQLGLIDSQIIEEDQL
jgi:hypothetical protein